MPVYEKTTGGEVYLRGIDERVSAGERVDVDDEFDPYLRERRDFEVVDSGVDDAGEDEQEADEDDIDEESDDEEAADAEVEYEVDPHPADLTEPDDLEPGDTVCTCDVGDACDRCGGSCPTVKTDGEVCGGDRPCQYHDDKED